MSPVRVLIAEDETLIAQSTAAQLQRLGYGVAAVVYVTAYSDDTTLPPCCWASEWWGERHRGAESRKAAQSVRHGHHADQLPVSAIPEKMRIAGRRFLF